MKRRAFLTLLGGSAASWPMVTGAQARARLGYLSGGRKGDNAANTIDVLRDSLRELV